MLIAPSVIHRPTNPANGDTHRLTSTKLAPETGSTAPTSAATRQPTNATPPAIVYASRTPGPAVAASSPGRMKMDTPTTMPTSIDAAVKAPM